MPGSVTIPAITPRPRRATTFPPPSTPGQSAKKWRHHDFVSSEKRNRFCAETDTGRSPSRSSSSQRCDGPRHSALIVSRGVSHNVLPNSGRRLFDAGPQRHRPSALVVEEQSISKSDSNLGPHNAHAWQPNHTTERSSRKLGQWKAGAERNASSPVVVPAAPE